MVGALALGAALADGAALAEPAGLGVAGGRAGRGGRRRPGLRQVLVRERVGRAAGAGALGVTALQDEDAAGGQPVADGVVEEVAPGQVLETGPGAGGLGQVEADRDRALVRGQRHRLRTGARLAAGRRAADVGEVAPVGGGVPDAGRGRRRLRFAGEDPTHEQSDHDGHDGDQTDGEPGLQLPVAACLVRAAGQLPFHLGARHLALPGLAGSHGVLPFSRSRWGGPVPGAGAAPQDTPARVYGQKLRTGWAGLTNCYRHLRHYRP